MKLPRSSGKVSRTLPKFLAAATGTALLILVSAINLHSQQSTSREVTLTPSSADYAAAAAAQNVKIHARPANTAVGRKTSTAVISNSPTGAAGPQNSAPDSGGPRFPGDLTFHGGNVVVSVQHHAIYMNPKGACTIASCWGDPEGFLSDLGKSEFIHVVDQYTGNTADDRYTVSNTHVMINYKPNSAPFTDADMRAVVHAAAAALGIPGGYGDEFHVFLPPGQDECFNLGFKVCYSPDDPKTFAFCAYHSSADFNDVGHVLYSVEPFQDASGCSSRPGTPNGQLADSTNNVLSHEVFETITDPDGTAWWNSLDNGIFGEEIGDECSFLLFTTNAVFFDPSDVTLNGKSYVAQPEYDNAQHACTTSP
jgi:hypothetical protein